MPAELFECKVCGCIYRGPNAKARATACEAQGSTPFLFEIGEEVIVPGEYTCENQFPPKSESEDYDPFSPVRGTVTERSRMVVSHRCNLYRVNWAGLYGPWSDYRTFDEAELLKFNPRETTDATTETEATSAAQS